MSFWDAGHVLTKEKLNTFAETHDALTRRVSDLDIAIEKAVGKAEPPNISVTSREVSKERIFLEGLRQQVYEQYRPAFNEVTAILKEHGFRRDELFDLGAAHETNRFLNYVRLTHVHRRRSLASGTAPQSGKAA